MCRVTSRRKFLQSASLAAAALTLPHLELAGTLGNQRDVPFAEFGYGDVTLTGELHERQRRETHAVLMGLSEDSLLKPFRQMSGQAAPGEDLGGWYAYDPGELQKDGYGFAPGSTFGQWLSALARMYAITGDAATREKVLRLSRLYAQTITSDFYAKHRFPAYCYDKLVCGLVDARQFAGDPDAFAILGRTTDAATPQLPGHAVERETAWRPNRKTVDWNWDESYTLPENLFRAYNYGAGERYRVLASQYLDDAYFDQLARGENDMAGHHAYSYVNALSSAMQAYLTLGSDKHLRAAENGFDILSQQSFATGGWGPDEQLRKTDSDDLFASLRTTHNSFETPCGSYAHFKLTRYLLRVTRDSRYGDSMERVMYNTVLGAKPLATDGRAFYYSDYNFQGRKVYHDSHWPCCSGTLPQVTSDYGISSYFRDRDGIYVNLYTPSIVRWTQGDTRLSLTQKDTYPFDSGVQLEVFASQPTEFAVNLRIPAWAEGTLIAAGGKRVMEGIVPGKFATIRRTWKSGDRIELELPTRTRLEAIDTRHPNTVALLWGPLVLFAIGNVPVGITSRELLTAKRVGPQQWQAKTAAGNVDFLPFTAIGDEAYRTYLNVV